MPSSTGICSERRSCVSEPMFPFSQSSLVHSGAFDRRLFCGTFGRMDQTTEPKRMPLSESGLPYGSRVGVLFGC